jgi:hypothetical protein
VSFPACKHDPENYRDPIFADGPGLRYCPGCDAVVELQDDGAAKIVGGITRATYRT